MSQSNYSDNNFYHTKLFVSNENSYYSQPIIHSHKIIKIACMSSNVCFVNELNKVYKINSLYNTYTQLTFLDNDDNLIMEEEEEENSLVNDSSIIKFFIAGHRHLILIFSQQNNVYCHGSVESDDEELNDTLQLLNDDIFNNDYNNNLEITHACCGGYSIVIVLNHSEIYFRGIIDPNESLNKFTKINFPNSYNTVDQFNTKIVKNISCGNSHLIVLNYLNEIYCFGVNELTNEEPFYFKELTKINLFFLNNNIKDAYALPLSYITVIVTNNNSEIYLQSSNYGKDLTQLFIMGESNNCKDLNNNFGTIKINQSTLLNNIYKEEIKELVTSNVTIENYKDFCNNCDIYNINNISIYGGFLFVLFVDNKNRNVWSGSFRKNNNCFTNEVKFLKQRDKKLFLNKRERILDIACGSGRFGILIGCIDFIDEYMLNNLKNLVNSSSFNDVVIKFCKN